ncbi:MAG: MaoC family dehydratase N-terminal domain-containing protein [Gaiellaceae bacterium]
MTESSEAALTEEMLAETGVESEPWVYEVTTTGIRAFARGVGYTDPVYYDAEAATAAGYDALPAPACYLGTPVYVPGRSDETFSVPLGTGPRPRFGRREVLDGSTEVVYERPLVAGDVITITVKLVDLQAKESRALGPMLIATTEATGRDARGDVVVRERSQAIFY